MNDGIKFDSNDFSGKFQNNESEIKSCEKSENISIDPAELFKEINLTKEINRDKDYVYESPIIRPINKFDLFNNQKSLGFPNFQQGNYLNDKRTSKFGENTIFSPPKKIIYNNKNENIKLQNNININFNNYYNIDTSSKAESKFSLNMQNNNNVINMEDYFNNNLKNLKSNNLNSNRHINSQNNHRFELVKSNKNINPISNSSKFITNNKSVKGKFSSKINLMMNNDISVTNSKNNANNKDDYFLSLFRNVHKNKNIQIIAEKVKRMTEKQSSKHSLIYNLNSNYKISQDQINNPKRNFKEKLKNIMSERRSEKDNLFDLDEIEQISNLESDNFYLPSFDKTDKINHSYEEIQSEMNENLNNLLSHEYSIIY